MKRYLKVKVVPKGPRGTQRPETYLKVNEVFKGPMYQRENNINFNLELMPPPKLVGFRTNIWKMYFKHIQDIPFHLIGPPGPWGKW